MGAMVPQITCLTIVYPTIHSGADQRKHQCPASLAFVREFTSVQWIPCTMASKAEMFPFDDVIMNIVEITQVILWMPVINWIIVFVFKISYTQCQLYPFWPLESCFEINKFSWGRKEPCPFDLSQTEHIWASNIPKMLQMNMKKWLLLETSCLPVWAI